MTRQGLSITDLSRMARAFDSVPKPRRYGGRRRGSGTPNPSPKPQEPVQGELLAGMTRMLPAEACAAIHEGNR